MGFEPGKLMSKLYGLLILLVVLQAVAIGLAIRFAADRIERDEKLLDRTGTMMEEVFPGIRNEISEVSKKATEIKGGISDLKTQVSTVDRHVGQVGRDVRQVGSRVEGMNKSLSGFVQDRSGLIWGHSLNPYILVGLLVVLAAAVPLCAWFFGRKREPEVPEHDALRTAPVQSFSTRLDRLSDLVEKIGHDNGKSPKPNPELEKLMVETERLINEARSELGDLAPIEKLNGEGRGGRPDKLH